MVIFGEKMKLTEIFENLAEAEDDFKKRYPLEKGLEISTTDPRTETRNSIVFITDHEAADADVVDGSWVNLTPEAEGSNMQEAIDEFLEKYEDRYDEDYGKGHLRSVLMSMAKKTGPNVIVNHSNGEVIFHDTFTKIEGKGADKTEAMNDFVSKVSSKYPKGMAHSFAAIAHRHVK